MSKEKGDLHQGGYTHHSMRIILDDQKKAFLSELPVPVEKRLNRLHRLMTLLSEHHREFIETMAFDFGHRHDDFSGFVDLALSMKPLRYAAKNLKKWLKPEKRKVGLLMSLLGGRAYVQYVPKGVVGIISPWNFPLLLIFSPLAGVVAAGNRVMIKPSELTPKTAELTAKLMSQYFAPDEITVCTGGPDVGWAFSTLPFDHLMFTGSTEKGRQVMRAASENLVPLTLEMGGKSPVIIGKDADMLKSVSQIMLGKLTNSGQICIGPDYLLIPEARIDEFIETSQAFVAKMYPQLMDNPEYTSIIGENHYQYLISLLDEAREHKTKIVSLNPREESYRDSKPFKLPPTILINPDEELRLMREEIFGPILPVKGYKTIDEAIQYINQKPRPLSLYYFGPDKLECQFVLSHTLSGGVTINNVLLHALIEELPFGGIGSSGMGTYHGFDGFKTFSHPRAMVRSPKINVWKKWGLCPPFKKKLKKRVARLLKVKKPILQKPS